MKFRPGSCFDIEFSPYEGHITSAECFHLITQFCREAIRGVDETEPTGCAATCSVNHSRDGACLTCGNAWSGHSGHSCPDGGRGRWPVAGEWETPPPEVFGGAEDVGGMEGISFVSINNAVLLMYNLFRSVSEYPLLDSNVAMVMEVRVLAQSIIRSFSAACF